MNIYSHVSEEDQIEAIVFLGVFCLDSADALPGIPGTEKPEDDEDENENGACVPA